MKKFILFLFVTTLSLPCFCFELPDQLPAKDRQDMLRILGLGTSGKVMSNPYPLGGFSGLEIGYAIEFIPIEDLNSLGSHTRHYESDFSYPKIIIGKGLYYNLDIFIDFIPFSENRGISDYGGMIRWGFYEATFLPATLSLVLHRNGTNILNQFYSQTTGVELVTGINVDNIALYLGGGRLDSTGMFIGGPSRTTDGDPRGLTDSGNTEYENISSIHTFVGTSIQFSNLFFALQLDRYYQEPMYSAKLGIRL